MNSEDFEKAYNAHFVRIYNYIRWRVDSDELADELTAKTFERALRGLNSYNPERAPFTPWLFAVAGNCVNAHFRRAKILRWFSLDGGEDYQEPVDTSFSVEANAERNDMEKQLLDALPKLAADERELLALKFYSGMSNIEIAAKTGLTPENTGVKLYRTIQKLRKLMGVENEPA